MILGWVPADMRTCRQLSRVPSIPLVAAVMGPSDGELSNRTAVHLPMPLA